MAAPKRTKDERERDLAKLAENYLHGMSQWQIAQEFGVSQAQICRDLQTLRKRWLESSLRDFDELKAQELAKIDQLEAEYWAAWQRSVGQKQKKTTERTNAQGGARDKAAIHTEEMTGDPRYLQGVERCIERRCKLLGLDAPAKVAPTDPTGDKPYDPITDTERAARIARILDDARARRDREALVSTEEGGADPG